MLMAHSSAKRRYATWVAAGLAVALSVPVLASPAGAADPRPAGLFGSQDPTFDGVYRQSLALLAYSAEGEEPPAAAVTWLLNQQCANGGFQAFRATPADPCASSSAATFSGPDSNSTALAAQALLALGEDDAADAALDFLRSIQNNDGGIPYYDGGESDANSTGLTAMAVSASGASFGDDTGGTGPSLNDALDGLQVGCEAVIAERGAYAYLGGDPLLANDFATVQALIGRVGGSLPVLPTGAANDTVESLDCGEGGTTDPAEAAAGYLASRVLDSDGTIPDAFNPGGTDWGSTRFAVMALAAAGSGASALRDAFGALDANQDAYLDDAQGQDLPGAVAELILATHAAAPTVAADGMAGAGVDRQIVVGTVETRELLDRLEATLNVPATAPTPVPEDSATPDGPGGSGGPIPSTDATNGGTELADSGATTAQSLSAAAAFLLLLGLGSLAVSRRLGDLQEAAAS